MYSAGMRWMSQPSPCLTLSTATRPVWRSSRTSETMPACRATWVSTTGMPATLVSRTRAPLLLLDSVIEQHDAQAEEQRVEGDEQAEPLTELGRIQPRDANGSAG